MELRFTPTLEAGETGRRLDRLLVPGALSDPALNRRIERLAEEFRNYASSYPLPLWVPGLVLSSEMRGLTEALFPMSRVSAVFDQLLQSGCRFPLITSGTYLHDSASWLDLLHRQRPQLGQADPATALRELAGDAQKRLQFLFALLLPHHFGGTFDRYPAQSQWLAGWLQEKVPLLGGRIRALDSACGSGEGTYGLAELVRAAGFGGAGCTVHGSTLEPIELFAAAHGFFPHDPERSRYFRSRVAPLLARAGAADGVAMEFYLDEVGTAAGGEAYQLVLCNGLLGGPLLHEPEELARAIRALASRLAPGGVLLAADRFHAGWRLRVPAEALRTLLQKSGLTPLELPEGVGGVKPG